MQKLFTKRGAIFLALFAVLTLIGTQFNFSAIIGADNQFFTLYQFFGPVAGGFLGSIGGVIAVATAEIIGFVFSGKELNLINILRLTPMLFAAYYFSKNKDRMFKDKLGIIIPTAAMVAFWMHPVGAQAWEYALLWTIPMLSKMLPDRLILRSLGATFTAHAVGSVMFIYFISAMTPAVWLALIPIAMFERSVFAVGISVSYIAFASVLNAVEVATDFNIGRYLNIERKYVINI